jgi:hypothetical protein
MLQEIGCSLDSAGSRQVPQRMRDLQPIYQLLDIDRKLDSVNNKGLHPFFTGKVMLRIAVQGYYKLCEDYINSLVRKK